METLQHPQDLKLIGHQKSYIVTQLISSRNQ